MTSNLPPRVARRRGLSILELSVILVILLSLVSILFIGTAAWKRGSDRAACVMTLRNMQIAARSYQNMYGYDYGQSPDEADGTRNIVEHLYSKGYIEAKLYSQSRGKSPCAAGGSYICAAPAVFPPCGRLFMNCSLVISEGHAPLVHDDW